MIEDQFELLLESSTKISEAIQEVGAKTDERTAELEALPKNSDGVVNRKQFKRILSKSASDLDQFTTRVEAELPSFTAAISTGFDAVVKMTMLSVDFQSDGASLEELNNTIDLVTTLRTAIEGAVESTEGYRSALSDLPRMTTDLNRAKRKAIRTLDSLLHEMKAGGRVLSEAEPALQSLIQD